MSVMRLCWLLVLLAIPPAFAAAPPAGRRDLYGDPLPAGAVTRLGSVRWRKAFGMDNSILSPDGRWMLSTPIAHKGDDSIYVWEVATGRLVRTGNPRTRDDESPFRTVAFMSDGKHLLSCDPKGDWLYLWAVPSMKLRWMCRGPGNDVTALAVNRDGRLAAAGTSKGTVHLYDLRRWVSVHSFRGEGSICGLAFTADGCLTTVEAAMTDLDFQIRRLDVHTRRELRSFEVEISGRLTLSPDGQHVAGICRPDGVCLWNVKDGTRRRVRSIPHDWIEQLVFSSDGRTLAALGDRTLESLGQEIVCFCDVGTANLLNRICWPNPPALGYHAVFSHDGSMLGVCDGSEVTWRDVRTGRQLQHRPGFQYAPNAVGYSRDGRSVLAASYFDISCWDAGTGRRLANSTLALEAYLEAFRPGGPIVSGNGNGMHLKIPFVPHPLFTSGRQQIVSAGGRLIDITDIHTRKTRRLLGHGADVRAIALSTDGRLLASADDKEVRLWDFSSGKQLWRVDTTTFAKIARGLAFSPDSRKLALGENRARLHLLAVDTGKLIASLQEEGEKKVDALVNFPDGEWAGIFSTDGRRLFTAHRDTFRVWDLNQRRPVLTEKRKPLEVSRVLQEIPTTSLVASADHRFLARMDPQEGLFLYEAASGQFLHRIADLVRPVCFASSGWQIAAMNLEESSILLWDLGTLFRSLPPPRLGVQTASTLWDDLAHRDAGIAHRALWRLADLPGMEDFLDGRLRLPPLSKDRLKRQLADLGSDDFATRQRAEEAIAKLGAAALPALEAVLAKTDDLEQRKRLERLLRPLDLDGTGALRLHRAVLALEARGTPAARKLLTRLAAGIPGARLTEEAKRAVKRLDGRDAKR